MEEEKREREADRLYWRPLFEELEKSRHQLCPDKQSPPKIPPEGGI
jgi:hypothetical protein